MAACALAASIVSVSPAAAQNIALGKPATQSSTYNFGFPLSASFAVDGDTNGGYLYTVSHTNNDVEAWWHVDLGATFTITGINVWNRTGCCSDRLTNFNVSVLADGSTNIGAIGTPTVWTQNFPGTAGVSTMFTPPANTAGRYVKVQLVGTNYLQLAEVEVFGTPRSVVPEPATNALVAVGLAGLAAVARRRRARAT